MKRIAWPLLLLALTALLVAPLVSARPAAACSCAFSRLMEYVDHADVIFEGEVTRFENRWATFEVQSYFKGGGFSEVVVLDYPGDCSFFAHDQPVSRTYVIFAYLDGGEYRTNSCTGSFRPEATLTGVSIEALREHTGQDISPSTLAEGPDTPWWLILPLAFLIPAATLLVPAFYRRRGGGH